MDHGLRGVGILEYEEQFGPLKTFCFQYLTVGLPALDGVQYLESGNALGVAMSALMRVPQDRRPWFKVQAFQNIAQSPYGEHKRYLLAECVDAYMPLVTVPEQEEFERLLAKEKYQEAKTMTAPTIFEEGLQRGKIEGKIEGQRESLMLLLEERFPPLDDSVRRRVNELPEAELRRLLRQVVHAKSLADLGLE